MASNQWCTLWGPIHVLDYADDLKFKGITNERLGDLQGTVGITRLELESSKEIIDLSLLVHLQDLESLNLDKCKFKNLKSLAMLPALEVLIIDNCHFDLQDLGALKNIKRLILHLKNQQKLPNDLCLPDLKDLIISGEKVNSIDFIRHSTLLEDIDIDGTNVTDISPLVVCKNLKYFSSCRLPVSSFKPLASLNNLERLGVHVDVEDRAIRESGFVEPDKKHNPEIYKARDALMEKIKQKDWENIYKLPWSQDLYDALGYCYSDLDQEGMNALLNHPNDEIFTEIFVCGIRHCHYARTYDRFIELMHEQTHRLYAPLLACTERRISNMDRFVIDCLEMVASPDYSEIYRRYLARRNRFNHLNHYLIKRTLNTVGKTKDHTLVEPIIDLLNFECKIIGGDNVFMKKIFKAIGQLGNASDIPLIEQNYSVENEKREDVKKEYQAMMAKLTKKKGGCHSSNLAESSRN